MLVSKENYSPSSASGFLVLEGVNGAGKTTLQSKIADYLSASSQIAHKTREPGATTLGKTIRSLVLEPQGEPPSQIAELLLFGADRAEHVSKVIKPAILNREWVISDRYYYSTIAFQGYGRRIDMHLVKQITELAIQKTAPDLVILLDLDPKLGLERTLSRQSATLTNGDAFEAEDLAFHTRIRNGFLEIARTLPEHFLVVDAAQGPEQVFLSVKPYLDRLMLAYGAKN